MENFNLEIGEMFDIPENQVLPNPVLPKTSVYDPLMRYCDNAVFYMSKG